jgi:hypothetical protein
MWVRFFNICPIWNDDSNNNVFYIIRLKKTDIPHINGKLLPTNLLLGKAEELVVKNNLHEILKTKGHLINKRTFIYFCFKECAGTKYNAPRPFVDTPALYYGLYRRRQEEWLAFHPPGNEWPNEEELQRTTAIILPGSGASAYEKEKKWILELESFIRNTYEKYKKIKFLAICFGLQIITQVE